VLADKISRLVHRNLSAHHPAYFQTSAALRSKPGLAAE
jgi:hypothetical protein